jgi:curli biogenesis system outer membrane secretion channel CsgG
MTLRALTRRAFLAAGASLAAATVIGRRAVAAGPSVAGAPAAPVQIFRLSTRGRRGSKAAKLHNANLRFATAQAAEAHRAHPGDVSRVVALIVSADEFDRLFGARNSEIADLRKLGGPAAVGDCNRNGAVVIDELIRGVNIALGNAPVSECAPFDRVADGQVTVDELVRGVRNALG